MLGRPSPKLSGYWKRLQYEYSSWAFHRREKKADKWFREWLTKLKQKPPDVLLGANFSEFGGVRGHLLAICKYSRLRVELVPPESLIKLIGLYRCQERISKLMPEFNSSAVSAIHSHVFPLFNDWCRQQQQNNKAHWVHTYHLNYYPEHAPGGLEPWMQQINSSLLQTASHACERLCVSRWQQEELRRIHGIDTIYLPNGVDIDSCLYGRADRFQREFRVQHFLLWVGRNDPVKNPDDFINLSRRLPKTTCVMIGGGLSIEALQTRFGQLPANIRVLGPQPQQVVYDALAAASVVVVTSHREGLPTLVLEAMVHQRPLVVSSEPGCMEAVGNGEFGRIYSLGDIEDLAAAVQSQLERPLAVEHALPYVRRHYDWKYVAAELDRIYLSRVAVN